MTTFLIEFHGGPLDGQCKDLAWVGSRYVHTTMGRRSLTYFDYRYTAFIELVDLTVVIAQYP